MTRPSVTVYDGFDVLPKECQRVLEAAGSRDLYSSLAWYQNFTRTALDSDDRVRIYVTREEEGESGVALMALRSKGLGGLAGRNELHSLSNYYSSLYGPVVAPGTQRPGQLLQSLCVAITAERPRWDFVRLGPMDRGNPLFSELISSLRAAGLMVQPYFCFGNWYLPVEGRSSSEYLATLPSQVRNTLRRKAKKLESSGRCRLTIVTGGVSLDDAIADYQRIYDASWKVPEPYPSFVPGLIRTCAGLGWLRLGLLYVDGEPAAAQIWIVNGKTASIYKLAYQEKFSELSVGTILTAHLMRQVIDVDRVDTVDYLTGDDPYKRDWMSHRRERWGILALNPRTARGAIGTLRHVVGRLVKRRIGGFLSRATERTADAAESTRSTSPNGHA